MYLGLPRLDAHRAGLQGLGERSLVVDIKSALSGLGFKRLLDPAHDSGAGGEPFAPDLAARKLAGFQEIIDGIDGHRGQRRDGRRSKRVKDTVFDLKFVRR